MEEILTYIVIFVGLVFFAGIMFNLLVASPDTLDPAGPLEISRGPAARDAKTPVTAANATTEDIRATLNRMDDDDPRRERLVQKIAHLEREHGFTIEPANGRPCEHKTTVTDPEIVLLSFLLDRVGKGARDFYEAEATASISRAGTLLARMRTTDVAAWGIQMATRRSLDAKTQALQSHRADYAYRTRQVLSGDVQWMIGRLAPALLARAKTRGFSSDGTLEITEADVAAVAELDVEEIRATHKVDMIRRSGIWAAEEYHSAPRDEDFDEDEDDVAPQPTPRPAPVAAYQRPAKIVKKKHSAAAARKRVLASKGRDPAVNPAVNPAVTLLAADLLSQGSGPRVVTSAFEATTISGGGASSSSSYDGGSSSGGGSSASFGDD